MTWVAFYWEQLLKRLRVMATTAATIAAGLFNLARHRGGESRVELAAGDEAPDFELTASDGRRYRLSAFRDRQAVVIAWFPRAFTGGCTAECESIGASSQAIRRFDAAYFGASVDTPETNRRFAASLGIDFPILGDPGKAVARAYGVLGASGFPSRWTFYIGRDGRILAIDKRGKTATHGLEIEKTLNDLHVSRRA
jgi:thioredoxin-dependent peroxiredoxin